MQPSRHLIWVMRWHDLTKIDIDNDNDNDILNNREYPLRAILKTCGLCDIDYISDNWEQQSKQSQWPLNNEWQGQPENLPPLLKWKRIINALWTWCQSHGHGSGRQGRLKNISPNIAVLSPYRPVSLHQMKRDGSDSFGALDSFGVLERGGDSWWLRHVGVWLLVVGGF